MLLTSQYGRSAKVRSTPPGGTSNTKKATLATAALGVATHAIATVYAGDTLNNGVTSRLPSMRRGIIPDDYNLATDN